MPPKNSIKWVTVLKERFLQADITASSVMIAYYLLLSLFPLSIAVGNILPFLRLSPERVLPYIDTIIPQAIQPVLNPLIISLLTKSSGGLLSVSAVGLVWSASRGIRFLQKGMNKAYGVGTGRGFLIKRGVSMLMVLLVLVLLVVFVVLFGAGQALLATLGEVIPGVASFNQFMSDVKWPASFIFLFCLLLLTYRVVPDVKLRLRDVWAGTLLATVGLLLLTQLFTIYLRFTTRNFNSYGALGTFFILMFWLNFSCMIILAGAVLNATIMEVKHGKAVAQRSRIDDYLENKAATLAGKLADKRTTKQSKAKPAQAVEAEADENEESTEE